MRRLLALAVVTVVAALAAVTALLTPAEGASTYRIDAIFDTAKGIIPGQLLKIAGAKVGTVEKVTLTPDFKARIQMTADRRFAPFHTDARCDIRPEGLIAENFVNCDPGSPSGGELKGKNGHAPTVPVERTSVPVNLTDLFNVFSAPTRNRFPLLVTTLGLGLAGRGEDLNQIILRANPTLARTREVLDVLGRQRDELSRIVTASDRIVGELARRRGRVQDFIEQAANVTTRTADHRSALAEDVRRLPALLDAARPALERLDEFTASGTPVLADLRAAAPDVNRLVIGLRPFARKGLPVLREVGKIAVEGRRAAKNVLPVIGDLQKLGKEGIPVADLLNTLFTSLRDRGFTEGLLNLLYYGSAGLSRFDDVSHILPAHIVESTCGTFATTPVAGCSANYGAAGTASKQATGDRRPATRRGATRAPAAAPAPGPAPRRQAAPRPRLLRRQVEQLKRTLDETLGRVLPPKRGRQQQPGKPIDNILDFLLR
jgi:phospholipid/cholesterol/gamma-HCH transport system substrate-binding protein